MGHKYSKTNSKHNVSKKQRQSLTIYSRLFNMGFEDDISFQASKKFPNDLEGAINFIVNSHSSNTALNINDIDIDKNVLVNRNELTLLMRQFIEHCPGIEHCPSLQRILIILRVCQTNHDQTLLKYLDIYKNLVNDYHHILCHHTFEGIYDEITHKYRQFYCQLEHCLRFKRNFRNRQKSPTEHEQKQQTQLDRSKKVNIYHDLLDTIHCYMIHSYDIGYRIREAEHNEVKLQIDGNVNDKKRNKMSYHDDQIKRLKRCMIDRRKELRKIVGYNESANSKYMTNIANTTTKYDDKSANINIATGKNVEIKLEEKKDHGLEQDEKINSDDDDDSDIDIDGSGGDIQYSFGFRYYYWDYYDDEKWYVDKKHDNLKHEIMNNNIHTLDIDEFNEIYLKAEILIVESYYIHKMVSINSSYLDGAELEYGICEGQPLTMQHLLSLIFYTDFDTLCTKFSATFRKESASESDAHLKARNSEYWHMSKYIREAVECFGESVKESGFEVYFHGVSKVYFHAFIASFCGPTSTTTNIAVAVRFATNDGIILELRRHRYKYDLKYFDCTFISKYMEDEKLFCGGYEELQFVSIRLLSHEANYKHFVHSLTIFDNVVNGKYESKANIKNEDFEIISDLIAFEMSINEEKQETTVEYPEYINKCFHQFCSNVKIVKINLFFLDHYYHPGFQKYFVHQTCSNLLEFSFINRMFKNCQQIMCFKTGTISSNFSYWFLNILKAINNYDFSELMEIHLKSVLEGTENFTALEMWKMSTKQLHGTCTDIKFTNY